MNRTIKSKIQQLGQDVGEATYGAVTGRFTPRSKKLIKSSLKKAAYGTFQGFIVPAKMAKNALKGAADRMEKSYADKNENYAREIQRQKRENQ